MLSRSSPPALALAVLLAACGSDDGSPVDSTSPPAAGAAGQAAAGASGAPAAGGSSAQGGSAGSASGGAGAGGAGMSGASGQAGTGGAAGASGAAGAGASGTGGTSGASGAAGAGASGAGQGGAGQGGAGASGAGGGDSWVTSVLAQYVDVWGAQSYNSPTALVVDPGGNTLVAGTARGTFADGAVETGDAMYGVVMKLDPSGAIVWLHAILGWQVVPLDIALDGAGNPVVVGAARDWIDLGQGVDNQGGDGAMFATALASADGSSLWGRTWSNPGEELASSVSVSPVDGAIVVLGEITKSLDPGAGPLLVGPSMIEMHLDALGQTTSARAYGAPGNGGCVKVRHRPDGHYVVAGTFREGTAVFGEGGEPQTAPQAQKSMFIAELTGQGAAVRTTRFQGVGSSMGEGELCELAIGPAGGIVVGGKLSVATQLGDGLHAPPGPFLLGLDADHQWLWQRAPLGGPSPGPDPSLNISGLAVSPAGTTVIIGAFTGSHDFGGGPLAPDYGSFLASYDATGAHLASTPYPGATFLNLALAPDGLPVLGAELLHPSPPDSFGWSILKNP